MSIEVAFILGLFIGHWLTIWILWRASFKVLRILASMQRDSDEQPAPRTEIIYVPLKDNDSDW
jgi:hypothetical protein